MKKIYYIIFLSLFFISCGFNNPGILNDGPASAEKYFSAFTIESSCNIDANPVITADFDASINDGAKTITATLPATTDLSAITPTFKFKGFTVTSGDEVQYSGKTIADFTSARTYTIEAGDGSTADYQVYLYLVDNSTPYKPQALNVNITGTAAELNILYGNYNYLDLNGDAESGTTYQWYVSDSAAGTFTPISGANSVNYALTSAETGKYLLFEVIPKTTSAPTEGDAARSAVIGPIAEDTYYSGTDTLTGDTLKDRLHLIIEGHTVFTYDEVWDLLKYSDEDPANTDNVICLYTGWSLAKSEAGGDGDQWNREHVWAKSHGDFDTEDGPGTDVHHLRPTDVSVNAARSNYDFDEAAEASAYLTDKLPTLNKLETRGTYKIWEPRPEVRGDIARMMFYMATRYEADGEFTDGSGFTRNVDLEMSESDNTGTDPAIGKLSTLLKWHILDPVDDWERRRNSRVFEYQKNRNPFIDHPEFVEKIWGAASGITAVNVIAVTADNSNQVTVTFDRAILSAEANDAASYSISGLTITAAELQSSRMDIVITTSTQGDGVGYTLTMSGLKDYAGNVIAAPENSQTFSGFLVDRPVIVSASSDSATTVLVTFDEEVNETNAENIANYSIGGLAVSAAVLQSGNKTVQLTTGTQTVSTSYTLTVSNVTGLTGDAIISGTTKTFAGYLSGATDLFFSEYIEGGSTSKAVEIFNGTGSGIDLSIYSIKLGFNGAVWSSTVTLTGFLNNGETYVLYYSSSTSTGYNEAMAAIADSNKQTTSSFTYNGDDAIGLFKNDIQIDAVGIQGIDPGSGWSVAGTSSATANHTLIRNGDVLSPTTDWTTSAGTNTTNSEWTVMSQDDFTNIGVHTFTP